MGIFDDLVQGIGREFNKVQSRSAEMMRIHNLSSQIRTLEGKKTAVLIEIGRLVFDKYQRGLEVAEEALLDKTREIVAHEHEITGLQAELESLRAQSDPNASASQKAEYKAGYAPTAGFNCPHCQAPANVDKSFCPACGCSLKEKSDSGGNGCSSSELS